VSAIPAGCTDGAALLAPSDAEAMGAELGPGWEVRGASLVLEVRLADFAAALAALNALAEIAEEENHHPDLTISDYRRLTVSLTTHDAGGLTANDFVVARRADGVLSGDA
jgi:4a-hydroxytetrahydrobiopterin dehydratase